MKSTFATVFLYVTVAFVPCTTFKMPNDGSVHAKQEPVKILVAKRSTHMSGRGWAESVGSPLGSYLALKNPEWLLVIAAFLTFGSIAWQSWEIRRSVNTARDTILEIKNQNKLLEFSGQQWFDIGNWAAHDENDEDGGTREISCTFELFNNTKLPITLRRVVTTVAIMKPGSKPVSYEVTENKMLYPRLSTRDWSYICRVPIILQETDMKAYEASELFVSFRGNIFFLDAKGDEKPQWFQQLAQIGVKKITLYFPAGGMPEKIDDSRTEEY